MKIRTVTAGWIIILFGLTILLSCGGKITTRPKPEQNRFTIHGVLVKDLDSGKDFAYFNVLRDSIAFDGATVKVGSYTLTSQGGGDYYKERSPLFSFGQTVSVSVSSSVDNFNLSTSVIMPGTFQITSINHPTVTAFQSDEVVAYFTLSEKASGYFKSTVRPDGSNGHTVLIPALDYGQTSIDRSAFYEGDTFVTGTYQVFLVAYNASFVSYPDMPFFLPDGLPQGNLSGANGTVGAGVIAASATIQALPGK
jgi:hypothetical protein